MSTLGQSLPGRHLDTSRPAGWVARRLNPTGFVRWLLVVCFALVLWPSTLGGRLGLVVVAGNSMEPTYQLGDAVVAWRQPVQVGDVILYRIPKGSPGAGKTVIHRVVGGDEGGWVTQGDNTAHPDSWFPTGDDVLGVAKTTIPLGAEALALMRSWWFIAILGGMAVLLFVWPEPVEEGEIEPRR